MCRERRPLRPSRADLSIGPPLLPWPCLFEEKAPEFDVKPPHALDFRRPRELYGRDCAPEYGLPSSKPHPWERPAVARHTSGIHRRRRNKQAMMTDGATYGPDASYRDSDGVGGGLTKGKWQA